MPASRRRRARVDMTPASRAALGVRDAKAETGVGHRRALPVYNRPTIVKTVRAGAIGLLMTLVGRDAGARRAHRRATPRRDLRRHSSRAFRPGGAASSRRHVLPRRSRRARRWPPSRSGGRSSSIRRAGCSTSGSRERRGCHRRRRRVDASRARTRRSLVLPRRGLRAARAVARAARPSGSPPRARARGSRTRSSARSRSIRIAGCLFRHRSVSLLRRRRAGAR